MLRKLRTKTQLLWHKLIWIYRNRRLLIFLPMRPNSLVLSGRFCFLQKRLYHFEDPVLLPNFGEIPPDLDRHQFDDVLIWQTCQAAQSISTPHITLSDRLGKPVLILRLFAHQNNLFLDMRSAYANKEGHLRKNKTRLSFSTLPVRCSGKSARPKCQSCGTAKFVCKFFTISLQ